MKELYSYIFAKAYFFCINTFKEKEYPEFFAIITVTLIAVTNLYVLLSLIEYLILPVELGFLDNYKYFSLASVLISLSYFNYKKKYKRILDYNKSFSTTKAKKLKIYSIIYLLLIFIVFFIIGLMIRNYNIANHIIDVD